MFLLRTKGKYSLRRKREKYNMEAWSSAVNVFVLASEDGSCRAKFMVIVTDPWGQGPLCSSLRCIPAAQHRDWYTYHVHSTLFYFHFKNIYIYLYLSRCINSCLYVCMCTVSMSCAQGNQKRVLDSLGRTRLTDSCERPHGAENQTQVLQKNSKCF